MQAVASDILIYQCGYTIKILVTYYWGFTVVNSTTNTQNASAMLKKRTNSHIQNPSPDYPKIALHYNTSLETYLCYFTYFLP